jgi:hypothetical protein
MSISFLNQRAECSFTRQIEYCLGMGECPREAARVLHQREHNISVSRRNPVLIASDVGGKPQQKAGITRFSSEEPADCMCNQ